MVLSKGATVDPCTACAQAEGPCRRFGRSSCSQGQAILGNGLYKHFLLFAQAETQQHKKGCSHFPIYARLLLHLGISADGLPRLLASTEWAVAALSRHRHRGCVRGLIIEITGSLSVGISGVSIYHVLRVTSIQ